MNAFVRKCPLLIGYYVLYVCIHRGERIADECQGQGRSTRVWFFSPANFHRKGSIESTCDIIHESVTFFVNDWNYFIYRCDKSFDKRHATEETIKKIEMEPKRRVLCSKFWNLFRWHEFFHHRVPVNSFELFSVLDNLRNVIFLVSDWPNVDESSKIVKILVVGDNEGDELKPRNRFALINY